MYNAQKNHKRPTLLLRDSLPRLCSGPCSSEYPIQISYGLLSPLRMQRAKMLQN